MKDAVENKRKNCYLGCEVPRGFSLRFRAYAEVSGRDKRILIASAVEEAITKWEGKLDKRTATAYDALLEAKARQNSLSVNDLKRELQLTPEPKGRPSRKSPRWPVKPKKK